MKHNGIFRNSKYAKLCNNVANHGTNKCTYLVMNAAILLEFFHVVGDCADGGYFCISIQPFPHSLGTSWAKFVAQSYHFNSATIIECEEEKSKMKKCED